MSAPGRGEGSLDSRDWFRRRARITALLAACLAATLAGGANATTPPSKPAGVRYVLLVRHGHYDRIDSLDDRTGNGLNALGREQARLIGSRLAALPVPITLFAASDLRRAKETADEIGAKIGMTAVSDTLLEECASYSSRPGFDAEHRADELAACQSAMEAAWAKYFRPSAEADRHDLLVCHGNVIRWFVNRALRNDTRHWTSLDIGNASLTVIAVRPDGSTRLVAYSDVGHLPVAKQSWLGGGLGWREK